MDFSAVRNNGQSIFSNISKKISRNSYTGMKLS